MEKQSFMRACRGGADVVPAAMRTLFEDYHHALLSDGKAALGDEGLAEDLLQETLIKAWFKCATFRGTSELFPWLKQIFRHTLIDMLRRRPDEVPLSAADDHAEPDPAIEAALLAFRGPVDPTPEESMLNQQSEACFRDCAARFARDHPLAATVVRWVAEEGLGLEEIAALLRRSPGATRQFVSQSRKKARIYFAEWYALTLGRRPGNET